MNNLNNNAQAQTLFGHPTGLFTLFFAEMWERFSYYGMRALLVFYMLKGFLGYGDKQAYAIYGAYTALVYMTPFFGGMIADRLLGARRAVVLGGLLMAAGHLMMTIENSVAFFGALALLIAGNGFFKPNISTIVGSLYAQGSPKRDAGFTIFYMGINLGAGLSPLLCGYIGETYGWHYGFGLATIGMLTGIAVFVAPSIVTQLTMAALAAAAACNIFVVPGMVAAGSATPMYVSIAILLCLPVAGLIALNGFARGLTPSALATLLARVVIIVGAIAVAWALYRYRPEGAYSLGVNIFVALSILTAGVVAWMALGRGGLPTHAGAPRDLDSLRRPVLGIPAEWLVYLGTMIAIPILAMLVSGFGPLRADHKSLVIVPEKTTRWLKASDVMHREIDGLRKTVNLQKEGDTAAMHAHLEELLANQDLRQDQHDALQQAVALAVAGDWSGAQNRIKELEDRFPPERFKSVLAVVLEESSKPAGLVLVLAGLVALLYLGIETVRLERIPRQRMYVVFILMFFSMLFWAFFEQAGSSVNNFTDRNVDRVVGAPRAIAQADVGQTITIQPTQAQLGHNNGANAFTITQLDHLRNENKKNPAFTIDWLVAPDDVGMQVAERSREIPASWFQSVNPVYILVFGLVFTGLWGFLGKRGLEPSTPVKFAFGLLQLGLGFGAFWYGAQSADERGMVALSWLFVGYLLQTTGELCLSPVGLSMVTKLSPAFLVSTVMGMWFLATAFSQFLAAIIAQFTGVGEGAAGAIGIPIPSETVHIYGDVFGTIAIGGMASAVVCLILSPLLKRWMHDD